jgi:hypothetical protein
VKETAIGQQRDFAWGYLANYPLPRRGFAEARHVVHPDDEEGRPSPQIQDTSEWNPANILEAVK